MYVKGSSGTTEGQEERWRGKLTFARKGYSIGLGTKNPILDEGHESHIHSHGHLYGGVIYELTVTVRDEIGHHSMILLDGSTVD